MNRLAVARTLGSLLFAGTGIASPAQCEVTVLTPQGATLCRPYGVSAGQQAGFILNEAQRASLWTGSASSWVDLTPPGINRSSASGVGDGQQVGFVQIQQRSYASLWTGTAA